MHLAGKLRGLCSAHASADRHTLGRLCRRTFSGPFSFRRGQDDCPRLRTRRGRDAGLWRDLWTAGEDNRDRASG